jgi:hypothetical protein
LKAGRFTMVNALLSLFWTTNFPMIISTDNSQPDTKVCNGQKIKADLLIDSYFEEYLFLNMPILKSCQDYQYCWKMKDGLILD